MLKVCDFERSGKKSWNRARASCKISVEEFKEHFEGVTAEKYELEPERIRERLRDRAIRDRQRRLRKQM